MSRQKYFLSWSNFKSDFNPIRSSCNECQIHSLYRSYYPWSVWLLSSAILLCVAEGIWVIVWDFRARLRLRHRGTAPSRGRQGKEKATDRRRERGNWLCSHHADNAIVPWQRLDGRYFIQHKMQDNRLAWLESARLASTGLLCVIPSGCFSPSQTHSL